MLPESALFSIDVSPLPVKQRAELRDRTAGPDLQETNFPYGGFLPEILERCSIVCKDRIWYDKYITVQTADR